jgi:23S rRNA pseudouridine2605 synthase
MERLNKVIARAGLASRRAADRLIEEGRVRVNGKVVTALGSTVDPATDAIKVDGKRIPAPPATHTYLVLNKPRGVVTTLSDPEGRPTVKDLLGRVRRRVFPVGRLDFQSEGLLLLTDDGQLSRDLMHPGCGVSKTYAVKLSGPPSERDLARLRDGVRIGKRPARATGLRRIKPGPRPWYEITVREGRHHLVRRMFEAVGRQVLKLRRVRYGGVELGDLRPGELRRLTPVELQRLRRTVRSGGGQGTAN